VDGDMPPGVAGLVKMVEEQRPGSPAHRRRGRGR
jgi:hypothetical protein